VPLSPEQFFLKKHSKTALGHLLEDCCFLSSAAWWYCPSDKIFVVKATKNLSDAAFAIIKVPH